MKKYLVLAVLSFALFTTSCKKKEVEIIEIVPTLTLKASPDYGDRTFSTRNKPVLLAEWVMELKDGPVRIIPTVYLEADEDDVRYENIKTLYLKIPGLGDSNKMNPSTEATNFKPIDVSGNGKYTIQLYGTPDYNFYGFHLTSKLKITYQWNNALAGEKTDYTKVVEGQTMKLE